MSLVRRVLFLVALVALVGASSTGFSRSACGMDFTDGAFEDFDAGQGCVDGNTSCYYFQ
jgi:hypothetical protein